MQKIIDLKKESERLSGELSNDKIKTVYKLTVDYLVLIKEILITENLTFEQLTPEIVLEFFKNHVEN
jgi:hypothetical protein